MFFFKYFAFDDPIKRTKPGVPASQDRWNDNLRVDYICTIALRCTALHSFCYSPMLHYVAASPINYNNADKFDLLFQKDDAVKNQSVRKSLGMKDCTSYVVSTLSTLSAAAVFGCDRDRPGWGRERRESAFSVLLDTYFCFDLVGIFSRFSNARERVTFKLSFPCACLPCHYFTVDGVFCVCVSATSKMTA